MIYTSEKIKELTLEIGGDTKWDNKKWISEDEIEELFILYSRYCETNLPTHMRDLNKKLHDIKMRMEK